MTEPHDLVQRARELIEALRTSDIEAGVAAGLSLDELARAIDSVTEQLLPFVVDEVRMQAGLRSSLVHGGTPGQLPDLTGVDPQEFFPYSPLIGPRNAISPPFRLWKEGVEVCGAGMFGSAYNGPPGAVHGGHVAALMDELLGVTGVVTGNHGFTGTLSVRYESPTPLATDLSLRGWVRTTEGRKAFICGEIRAGDTLCATAEGVFIQPRPVE